MVVKWWFNGGLTNKNGDFNGTYPTLMVILMGFILWL
jgi:hypothetical protein